MSVVPSQDLLNANFVDNQVLIVWKDETRNMQMSFIDKQGGKWELRAVVTTSVGRTDVLWEGALFSRHGGDQFPDWWKQERLEQSGAYRVEHIELEGILQQHSWDVCAYVKTGDHKIEKLRNDYLASCGGQLAAECARRAKPLVVACPNTGTLCGLCDSDVLYICPEMNCDAGLCKVHQKEAEHRIDGSSSRVKVAPTDWDGPVSSAHGMFDQLDESDESSSSDEDWVTEDDHDYFDSDTEEEND